VSGCGKLNFKSIAPEKWDVMRQILQSDDKTSGLDLRFLEDDVLPSSVDLAIYI
jgi:hypothetical protein